MKINQVRAKPINIDVFKNASSTLASELVIKAKRHIAGMDPIRSIQRSGMQLGLYCLLVAGSVGVVANGSKMVVDQLHTKMSEMGYEVAQHNHNKVPKNIQTASIRPTIK
nr:hypothetical protein [uncultured Cohaesibacter sp.]